MKRTHEKMLLGAFTVLLFSGCATMQQNTLMSSTNPTVSSQIDLAFAQMKPRNEIQESIKNGLIEIRKGDFDKASDIFEKGLRLSSTNGHLHFLNALAYHMNSLSGSSKMLSLAEAGYTTALRFDKSNYLAAYLLGHIYFEQKKFLDAQNLFAYGLIYAPKDAILLRALAVSSYYCNDIALNQWAATKAFDVDSKNLASLRTLMFSKASVGDLSEAKELLDKYKLMAHHDKENTYMRELNYTIVEKRVNDWKNYYASADAAIFGDQVSTQSLLSYDSDDDSQNYNSINDSMADNSSNNQTKNTDAKLAVVQKEGIKLPNMTLVDVTIIRTEELKSQAKGINLLAGLKATLSGTLFEYDYQNGTTYYGSKVDNESITITPAFTMSGLEYNLNIFNDGSNKAEVLARPSLLAIENRTSKFFSGGVLHVQLSSNNSDGSMEDVPVGIHLEVTPKFYGEDTVEVTVHADRSYLDMSSAKVGFTAFSQTSDTSVDATAVLKFDETLILSGLTENSNDTSQDGVPFLQDVPGIQYLFSRAEEVETKKSILILITPRKARYANQNMTSKEIEKELKEKEKVQTAYTADLKKNEGIRVSNIDAAIAHLARENKYYRQFRTGDVDLDSWNNEDTILGAFKRILGFIYY